MDEKCPQPSPHALAYADETTFINRLISMRIWAEHRGEVPRGEPPGNLVKRLLDELLGRGDQQPAVQQPPMDAQGSSPGATPGDGVGSLWPKKTLEDGDISPAKDGGPLEAAGPPDAHTTHNISAAPMPYEPADDTEGGDASGCCNTTCDATKRAEDGPEEREAEKKNAADISADTAEQAGSGTATATTGRGYAEQERLALAELRRTLSTDIWPSWADYMVPNLLAEGQTNLMLQGFTREQRQALLGWQRVMDLRGQETGARSQMTGVR
jgi:hypothetical protein